MTSIITLSFSFLKYFFFFLQNKQLKGGQMYAQMTELETIERHVSSEETTINVYIYLH